MNFIGDLEHELMCYCLDKKGKWWANHFFYNKEVKELYAEKRKLPVSDIFILLEN